jgi:RNA polymerase sigma-70 factor (ECF subfamily)
MPAIEEALQSKMIEAQAGTSSSYRDILYYIAEMTRFSCARYGFDYDSTKAAIQMALVFTHRVRHTWNPNKSFVRWAEAIMNHAISRMAKANKANIF